MIGSLKPLLIKYLIIILLEKIGYNSLPTIFLDFIFLSLFLIVVDI